MTAQKSIKAWEADLSKREKRIIEIERKLCRQQSMLIQLIQEIKLRQSHKPARAPTIEQVLERFITKAGKDSEETHRKYRVICRYTKATGLTLSDKYSKLHTEQSLLQIVQVINRRTDIQGDQKIRHVRWISEFVKFAAFAYPDMYKNDVLIGLPTIKRTQKNARRPHTPYSDSQLKMIFSPSHSFFCKNPDLFWGCMIALFTGSRKNAVFTLQYKDILQHDGIWCINFIEDCPGIKKLKTEDSQRLVPMHTELIKMGFLDYVHRKQHSAPTDFIFQNVCLTAHGALSSHMIRKFFRFLEQIGIKNERPGRYDFHSFRKNANITMEKCGIIRSYIDKIIGWQSRGSEGERSYSNYTIKQLSEQLELLRYKCLREEFKKWKKIMSKR